MQTMKVKPWGEGQGDHVVINAEDFDPAVHESLEQVDGVDTPESPAPRGRRKKVVAEGTE